MPTSADPPVLHTRMESVDTIILILMPLFLYVFFFCIPIVKGVAGPVYVWYCLLYGVHLILRKEKKYIQEPHLYYILLLPYFILAALSLTYTSDIEKGLKILKTHVGLIMIPVLIETVSNSDRAKQYLYAYAGGGTVLAIIAIYQGLIMHINRPPTFLHPVHEGHLLMFPAVISFALLISEIRLSRRLLPLIFFILQGFALYLNGTRGAWMGLGAVIIAAPFLIRGVTILKRLLYCAMLVLAVLVILFSPYGQRKLYQAIDDVKLLQRSQYVSSEGALTSLGGRSEMWKASMSMFLKHPVIGVGIGDWEKELGILIDRKEAPVLLREFNQTHNIFLDALSTRGIIGLSSFIVILVYPLVYAWKRRSKTKDLFCYTVIFAGIAFMVTGLSDTLVYIRWSFLSYIALTGVGLALLVRNGTQGEGNCKPNAVLTR